VLHHLRYHAGALQRGLADPDIAVRGDEQDIVQLDRGADLGWQPVDIDKLRELDPVLSAAAADYGVDITSSWAPFFGTRCSILPAVECSVHL
jgi:hypothetical protein